MKTSRITLLTGAAALVLAGGLTVSAFAQGPGQRGAGDRFQNSDGPAAGFGQARLGGGQFNGPAGPGGPNGPGMGQHPGGPGGPGHGPNPMIPFWNNEDLVEAISLTDAQIALLETSHAEARTALEGAQGSVREAREGLKAAMDVDAPNLDEVYAAIDAVAATQTNIKKIVAGHGVTVKTVLTAEQEEAMREFVRDNAGAHMQELRATMQEFRELVRDLRADGEISDADMQAIDEAIENLPERVQRRVERIRDRIQNGDLPEPPAQAAAPALGRNDDAQRGQGVGGRRGPGRLPALPQN